MTKRRPRRAKTIRWKNKCSIDSISKDEPIYELTLSRVAQVPFNVRCGFRRTNKSNP